VGLSPVHWCTIQASWVFPRLTWYSFAVFSSSIITGVIPVSTQRALCKVVFALAILMLVCLWILLNFEALLFCCSLSTHTWAPYDRMGSIYCSLNITFGVRCVVVFSWHWPSLTGCELAWCISRSCNLRVEVDSFIYHSQGFLAPLLYYHLLQTISTLNFTPYAYIAWLVE